MHEHAQDMSFIMPDSVHQPAAARDPPPGWLIRSMRMRMRPPTHSTRPSTLAKNVARRGSMQLSGMFMDNKKNPRSEPPPHTSGAKLELVAESWNF